MTILKQNSGDTKKSPTPSTLWAFCHSGRCIWTRFLRDLTARSTEVNASILQSSKRCQTNSSVSCTSLCRRLRKYSSLQESTMINRSWRNTRCSSSHFSHNVGTTRVHRGYYSLSDIGKCVLGRGQIPPHLDSVLAASSGKLQGDHTSHAGVSEPPLRFSNIYKRTPIMPPVCFFCTYLAGT